MAVPTDFRLQVRLYYRVRLAAVSSLLACGAGSGCSLQSFDYLTNGGASATSPNVGGGTQGGASGTETNTGGAGGSTSNASSQGGTAQGGITSASGGVAQTGGSATGGASVGPCSMYAGTGGSVVKPPSNDFESDATGWATVSESVAAISLVSATDACNGSSYMRCQGTTRIQNWDGPSISLLPYMVTGHAYVVTLAARFDPQDPPPAATSMKLTQVLTCSDTSVAALYTQLQDSTVLTTWVRYTGTLATTLSGCSALKAIGIYVETDASAATKSIDVDDFQLIDVTAPTTGSGGATAAGGAPATGGMTATATGSGGLAATGGNAASGGASASGGAPETGGAMDAGDTSDAG